MSEQPLTKKEIIEELEARGINLEDSKWHYENRGSFHGKEVEEVLYELAFRIADEATTTKGKFRINHIEQRATVGFHRLDHILAGKDDNGNLPNSFYNLGVPLISRLVKKGK